jgi:membrane protease YdiL (CAAX protease family)
VVLEAAAAAALPGLGGAAALWATGALRAGETALCLLYWRLRGWGWEDLGLTGPPVKAGLAVGIAFCAAFAGAALLAEAGGRLLADRSFLAALAGPRPPADELWALLAVGAGIAPLFEELAFQGILYGGLRRRLRPVPAGAAATAAFAAAHLFTTGVPWVQAVGGLAFFAAYELSGSLWAPILVHACGNLALFLLPLAFS